MSAAALPAGARPAGRAHDQELTRVVAKRDKLIEAISAGMVDASEVKADLDAAISRRDTIQAELAVIETEPKLEEPLLAVEDESRFIGKNFTDFTVRRAEAKSRKRSTQTCSQAVMSGRL